MENAFKRPLLDRLLVISRTLRLQLPKYIFL